jgi:hypothetical protein
MANNFKVVFFEKGGFALAPLRHQVFNQNSGHGIALIRFLSCPIERLLNS